MFKRIKSIRARISIAYIIVISTSILLVSIFFMEFFGSLFVKRVEKDQEIVMNQIKLNVENVINTINQSTWYLYNDGRFADLANSNSNDTFLDFKNREQLDEIFRFYVKSPIPLKDYVPFFYIYPGVPVASYLETIDIEEIDGIKKHVYCIFNASEVSGMKWFKDTENSQGRFNVFLIPENKGMIFISRLIKNQYIINAERPGYLGVAVMGININQLQKQLEFSMLTKNSRVHLVNNENVIVFSNDEKVIGSKIGIQVNNDIFSNLGSGETEKVKYKGKEYVMSYYNLNWGLRLVSSIPYSDITESFEFAQKICIIISVICILIAVFISISVSKSISSPIVKLSRIMKQITDESGIKIEIPTFYKDEVGQLYVSFDNMLKRINTLVKDIYESTKIQKKLELKALQAQINPHFVYNTLDSINWVALCNGEKDIVKMVSALAFIMRYSISNPEGMVSVGEELEHVKNYIGIQMIRYGENFDVEYDIDTKVLEYKMPKFIIQPIVENAIIHGVEKIEDRGRICIDVREGEGKITIRVIDNGVGGNTDEMNAYLRGEKTGLKDSDGFGIRNVDQRVSLNYGAEYGLSYSSNPAGGIIASVVFPLSLK